MGPRKSASRKSLNFGVSPPVSPQASANSENITWEDRRRSSGGTTSTTASTADFVSLELVAPNASGSPTQSGPGLGAIHLQGRDQVMQQWTETGSQRRHRSNSAGSGANAAKRGSTSKRDSTAPGIEVSTGSDTSQRKLSDLIASLRTSMVVKSARGKAGPESPRLEWSSLSTKARKALQQWYSGQIGGRHCLMLLEYDAAIAFFISPLDNDEVQPSDLRGGVVLSALSGLSSEVRGGWESGWLHDEVFAKTPSQVLEDAIRCVLDDTAQATSRHHSSNMKSKRSSTDTSSALSGDRAGVTADQVNLALRRRAMQAQGDGMRSLLGKRRENGPRCSEEYMRTQVWLELVRMHVEGPSPEQIAQEALQSSRASIKEGSSKRSSSGGRSTVAPTPTSSVPLWDDQKLITELKKKEADIETESKTMTLDSLRTQNRSIEAYLMRLVRQRDQLKHIAKLAEECDSYLVLGLEGPNVSDSDIKRAYHDLARREHPDKAGVGNKERFQEIQQAYSAVTKRRKSMRSGSSFSEAMGTMASTSSVGLRGSVGGSDEDGPSSLIREVVCRTEMAREAAETITAFAHDAFSMRQKGMEARGMQKRAALKELQSLTKKSLLQLRQGAFHLRSLNECSEAVTEAVQRAIVEYGEWTETAMAGAGLKERAEVMQQVGSSCTSTAEQLERMSENDEATMAKIDRVTCEVDISSGCRVLSDGLMRTATVVRCAADEAIGAATAALELACSLAVLDRQQRQDRADKEAEKAAQQWEEEQAKEAQQAHASGFSKREGSKANASTSSDLATQDPKKRNSDNDEKKKDDDGKEKKESDPLDKLPPGSSREDVKNRQAALRVRHLQCLGSLNEEVLTLQKKLKLLMERCEGLMPSVATQQKGSVFDLVAQLLQNSLSEAARLAADSAMPSRQVLERCFSYALALEHASTVALPAEVRTQALKLAAIIDVDLLCQIIEGPFKRRLMGLEKMRPASLRDKERVQQLHIEFSEFIRDPSSSRRSLSHGPAAHSRASAAGSSSLGQAWVDAVQYLCHRLVEGLRKPLPGDAVRGAAEYQAAAAAAAAAADPFVGGVFF